jgi:F-type H+-transporting ATPase subunit alpha
MVMFVFAGTEGALNDVPVEHVQRWRSEFIDYMHAQRSDVVELITGGKKMTDEVREGLEKGIEDFNKTFQVS